MDFMRNGSIRYISMENWMAYTGPVVLQASPGVNIIAASNGSGKSAIVCAIALSLGFDLSILSRGENIASFVKRGCMNSTLKVSLVDFESKGGTVDIERRITLTDNREFDLHGSSTQDEYQKNKYSVRNEWFLNGKSSNINTIKTINKRLNIHLDNLLTFLAQANVGKFASMTQHEIFRSTLKSINNKYVDDLDSLIDISQNLKSKIYESKLLEDQLNSYETKLSELRTMSEKMVKVKDATLYMNIVKLKLHQIKLYNISRAHENTRKKIGETNNQIYSMETKQTKLEGRYKRMESTIRSLLEESKRKVDNANNILRNDHSYLNSNNILEGSDNEPLQKSFYDSITLIKNFSNEFSRSQSQKDISEENAETISRKIDLLNEEIESTKLKMITDNELVDKIARCKINEESLRYKLRKYKPDSNLNLQELQFEALMNHLSYMKRDLISRYMGHCKLKSIEPRTFVVSDIKVKGKLNTGIVEDSIGNYLDCILLDSSEYEENVKIIREFRIPTITAPSVKNVLCKVTEKMKSYGVIKFVHEIIECSEITLQSLSSLCQINETFIIDEKLYNQIFLVNKNKKGTEKIFSDFYQTMMDEISKQIGKKVNSIKYFVGNKKHLYKHFFESNYFMDSSAQINTKPKVIVDSTNYANDYNNKEKEVLENELDAIMSELYELNKKLNEQNELNKHLNRSLYTMVKQKSALETTLRALNRNNEEDISNKNWDNELERIKKNSLKSISNSIIICCKNLVVKLEKTEELKNNLIEANESYNQYCNQLLSKEELYNTLTSSKAEIDDLKSSLKLLQNTYEEQTERIDKHKNIILETKQSIKTSEELFESPYFTDNYSSKFSELKKSFENKIVNFTESELEKEIIKAEDQVKQLESDDFEEIKLMKMIQNELNNREKCIKEITETKYEVARLTGERNQIYQEWENKVKRLVKEIDTKFGKYMEYIGDGSGGQVRLEVDPENIKESKIRILVKFEREKDLLPLTSSYQSGGERGVTTMVYILSVQNLTNNPFFVIDEINQGLDSHYERNLMKLLLSSVKDRNKDSQEVDDCDEQNNISETNQLSPQYFILTPQLISGYDLSNATLHFPLNGPGVDQNLKL